ncbi:MAG: hypothetical protein DMG49_10485 [Acidobacteria bacterium]|nr:MAG: hypothetical protein DMG49_10485 [Acidobacteriota bacterium]
MGSTAVLTSFAKRKIAFGTWPTNVRKFIISLPGVIALAAGIALVHGEAAGQASRAQAIANVSARIVAVNIPGASAISQVGTFLNNPAACAHPIPTLFASYTQPGAVLDPNRILVGSRSNFDAPLAIGVGREGSFLSIGPKWAGRPQRSGGFCTERRSVLDSRRGRADVQREQPPLVQQRP